MGGKKFIDMFGSFSRSHSIVNMMWWTIIPHLFYPAVPSPPYAHVWCLGYCRQRQSSLHTWSPAYVSAGCQLLTRYDSSEPAWLLFLFNMLLKYVYYCKRGFAVKVKFTESCDVATARGNFKSKDGCSTFRIRVWVGECVHIPRCQHKILHSVGWPHAGFVSWPDVVQGD